MMIGNNKVLVSIVVPCYNQAQFLSETLDSLIDQTYLRWECIIVNDGSTDNTAEIATAYCKKDNRFRYVEKKNGGLSSARNAGLNIARGDYIQFLDSDDLLANNKLEIQLKIALSNNVDVVVSKFDMYDSVNHVFYNNKWSSSLPLFDVDSFLYSWGKDFVIAIHAGLFRSAFLKEKNINFNEDVLALEDWIFWSKLSLEGASFVFDCNVLAHYRVHCNSMTRKDDFMRVEYMKVLFVLYDMLSKCEKEIFKNKMSVSAVDFLRRDFPYYLKIAQSKEYKLGRIAFYPLKAIKKFFGKNEKNN